MVQRNDETTRVLRRATSDGDGDVHAGSRRLRIGSTFTGAGGLDMALRTLWPHAELAWFSEVDDHAAAVFSHHHPDVPNLGDVTAVDWSQVESVDVLVGGFPCQDISHAGHQAGIKEGTRSGLWFELLHAAVQLRPRLMLLENVAAITSAGGGLDVVLGSLAEVGWDAEWTCLRASDVGAPHRRDRWFAAAWPRVQHPRHGTGGTEQRIEHDVPTTGTGEPDQEPADPDRSGLEGRNPISVRERGRQRTAGPRNPSARLTLLPTPAAHDPGYNGRLVDGSGEAAGHVAQRVYDPDTGRLVQTGLKQAVSLLANWGEYGPAINRWRSILGRPAPAPTDADGRLSPRFVEWMMGWPDRWTCVADTSRTQRLKMLGNGVVPHQAVHAYAHLLTAVEVAA